MHSSSRMPTPPHAALDSLDTLATPAMTDTAVATPRMSFNDKIVGNRPLSAVETGTPPKKFGSGLQKFSYDCTSVINCDRTIALIISMVL